MNICKSNWAPLSSQVDKENLILLLHATKRVKVFCWHNWVYWTFGKATKAHRVCKKCYKKQQNTEIVQKYGEDGLKK